MDPRTANALEIDSLTGLLAGYVQSPLGRNRVAQLRFSTDISDITRALDLTGECRDHLAAFGGFGLSGISDYEESLAELAIEESRLEPLQIVAFERLLAVGMDLRALVNDPESRARFPLLAEVTAGIPDLRRLLASIRGKVLPNGELDDNASPELRRIRREINERRARIYRSLESLMRDQPASIQDEIVTIRNGRFVIPIRTDSRGLVQGVMHGLSSSGQTSFIEPMNVINQNNDLVRLHEEEEIEINRILSEISDALRASLPGIRQLVESVGEVDFAQAKARLAADFNCVRPRISAGRRLLLGDARHLLLESMLRKTRGKVVPISLEMDEQHQVLVVSGPNAGGKTVVLKTVGLIVAMTQMGLHVPAAAAEVPVFQQVFADIGDQQSIAANLSTFTAHMRNISEMASILSGPALVLLDEVGTGTDPQEGAALAVAVIDYFRRTGATTLATTHYNELKMWVSETQGVLTASVEFDERTLRPTYRLLVGVAGASSGLEIAQRMSVPEEIVIEARSLLAPVHERASGYLKRLKAMVDEQEQIRAALEEERQATADKFERLELEFAGREAKRQKEFESELARVLIEFAAESRRLIDAVRDRTTVTKARKEADAGAAKLRRTAAVVLRKQIETPEVGVVSPPLAPSQEPPLLLADEASPISPRDRVFVRSLGKEGVVESVSGDTYSVLVGAIKLRAKHNDLRLVLSARPAAEPESSRSSITRNMTDIDRVFDPELNVIGLPADDAADRVDKFLDEAAMAGVESVRIIHGHGAGILRRAIGKLLTAHLHVQEFHSAPPNQGGGGVTIVQLRK
jgi:DNA mismatch repair protein MutS2